MPAFWVLHSGLGDFDTADLGLSDLVVEELERLEGADRATAEPSGDDVEKSDEADGNGLIIWKGSSEDSERLNDHFTPIRFLLSSQHAAPCPLSQQYASYSEQ